MSVCKHCGNYMWETAAHAHKCPPEWEVCFGKPDSPGCDKRRTFCTDAGDAAEKAVEAWDDDGGEGPSENVEVYVRRADASSDTPWQRFKVTGEYTVTYSSQEIEDDET